MERIGSEWLSRRKALGLLGLTGAAAVMASCAAPAASPTAAPAEKGAPAQKPAGGQKITLKVGLATLNDLQHKWGDEFKARAEKLTDGIVDVQVYPSSQLGNNIRMLEGVTLGTIECSIQPPEFMSQIDKRLAVGALPFLFKDTNNAIAVISKPSVIDALGNLAVDKGILGTTLIVSGPMAVQSHVPIRTIDDFRGKKLRVLNSQVEIDTMQALGATGVPLALDEVATALQQKTVDGVQTTSIVAVTLKYHDIVKYMTRTAHSYVTSLAVFSTKWWNEKVPKDLQPKIVQASREAGATINEAGKTIEEVGNKTWREKAGNEVIDIDNAFKSALREKLAPIQEKFVRDNPNAKDIVDLLRKEAAAAG